MTLYDTTARDKIDKWRKSWHQTPGISLVFPEEPEKKNQQDIEAKFTAVAEALSDLAPGFSITIRKDDIDLPGFQVTDNLMFCAFPMEQELDPFLQILEGTALMDARLSAETKALVDKIDIPVQLTLYIALFCPHCPEMVKTLAPLALYSPNIHLTIIDGTLFDTAARADDVRSAPCLILDSDFRWTGQVSQNEIVHMILDRDPARLSPQTLRQIMEQGEADWIADQMIKENQMFDAFIQLVCHPMWSVRLGAMVIIEKLASDAPQLAGTLAPILMVVFDDQDITAQGDLLYALGEIGDSGTAAWIKEKKSGFTHPDLVEAADDALESIEERL